MYFIDSDEYLRSYVFAHFYILCAAHHHVSGDDFFLPDIYLYSSTFAFCIYLRTLHFRVQASNHKSQANPRVFVVYTLSSYKEHRFLLSRLISPLRYVFLYVHAVRYFHGVCFFTPCWRKIVREKTRVFFHDTRLLSRVTHYLPDLSFPVVY